MDAFVSQMDAIVIGTIRSVVDEGTLNSYNEADNARNIRPGDKYSSGLPRTDYELAVDRVLLDDESITPGKSITFRMLGEHGHISSFPSLMKMPRIGDYRLYGLGRDPDGESFGLHSWWSQFLIDCPTVTHADDLHAPVEFADASDTALFIQEIQSAVARLPG